MKRAASSMTAAASTAGLSGSVERVLARAMYKALVSATRTIEAEPSLKALLWRRTAVPLMLASPELRAQEQEAAASPTTSLIDSYYTELLGSPEARFYHPYMATRPLLDIVRSRFRQPLPTSSSTEREAHFDAGLQAVQHMEMAISLGKRIGLVGEKSATSTTPAPASVQSETEQRRPPIARAASPTEIGPGMLLVPHPLMQDPFWRHSLILLLESSPTTGFTGAVINRPESRLFAITKNSANKKYFKGFYGGPVKLPELYWLRTTKPSSSSHQEVLPGLYYGSGLNEITTSDESDGSNKNNVPETPSHAQPQSLKAEPNIRPETMLNDKTIKLFFGLAAWVPGQLEAEIKEGTWFVAQPEGLESVFPDPPLFDPQTMPPSNETISDAERMKQSAHWGRVLSDMGGTYAHFAKFVNANAKETPDPYDE